MMLKKISSWTRENLPILLAIVSALALSGGMYLLRSQPASPPESPASPAAVAEQEGKAAPGFDIKSIGGERISLDRLRGRVVVIDFWSITCGPCVDANEHLQELYDSFGQQGLSVIGLSIDKDEQAVKQFLRFNPVSYPVGLATDEVIRAYGGVFALPQTFIVDKDGKIVRKYEGFSALTAYQMERTIKKLLSQG